MPEATLNKTTSSTPSSQSRLLKKSPFVSTTSEALKNYQANEARSWYKDSADRMTGTANTPFQRLRNTCSQPEINPKFKLRRDNKFYAIGSCFARGLRTH